MLRHYGYTARPDGVIGESAWVVSAYINKKEDETLFKTGNSKNATPSNASSSIYSLLNKLQNVNNDDFDSDENVKFSLKDPVEKTKDLIAVHNISESNLLKSLDLGGFPMPSIAVMAAPG